MAKDNNSSNNTQKLQYDLNNQRKQWLSNRKALEKQKDKLGYKKTPLKSFSDEEFIREEIDTLDEHLASEIIEIHHNLKDLENEYKLLWPEEYVVHEFNKKHAIVHIDQTYILTEKHNIFGEKDFSLENRASFKAFYEDEVIQVSPNKKRNKADIWLKSPKRNKYTGITFNPTTTNHLDDNYNIWKGFAYKSKKGSPLKYWAHVKDNICSGNIEHYRYLRKWLAYIFKQPDEIHTALVLCGSQGVGKNSFVEPLGKLFGQHYVLLNSISELVSNFNYHLKNAVLIHANEALWGGNKKEIGTVKAMVTEHTCLIEGKGKDRIMVKNFKHLILSSNEDWPVHMDTDDRRFFVLRVSEAHKEDHDYFAQIEAELLNGGYEGLLYDLLHEDINSFNPRQLPYSKEAFLIKLRSADSSARYIYEALSEGNFDLNRILYHGWKEQLARNEIYIFYSNWCHASNETTVIKNRFGSMIKKLIPSIKDQRPTINGKRAYVYKIPTLEQAKKDFCKAFKVNISHIFSITEEL